MSNITNEWPKIKLGDISEVITNKISVSKLGKNNYISTENMLSNRLGICEATNLPNILLTPSFQVNDILVSNIRPYFKKIWYAKFYGGCSNDVLIFRAKKNIDSKFLYYVLSSDDFFEYAMSTSKGTKMPRGDKIAIMNYSVPKLDIATQKKIAAVLSALDDKIELNNKINQNLEQQAQAIFKSWFVDFEPFGGKMPDDWQEKRLLNIADYTNGLAMQKFRPLEGEKGLPVLKIRELRQGFCDINSESCTSSIKNEYIVHDGDVIFSWSGSLLIDFWCSDICGLNQHLFKITSKKFDKWFYYSWTHHHLEHFISIAEDKATTMGHIKREDLAKAKVVIPGFRCYQYIGSLISPLYELIIKNRIENLRLAQLRDALLPKLMSGEVDVSKVNISIQLK